VRKPAVILVEQARNDLARHEERLRKLRRAGGGVAPEELHEAEFDVVHWRLEVELREARLHGLRSWLLNWWDSR
jgi:hypothetical protein